MRHFLLNTREGDWMNVSIDGILNTAKKMRDQKHVEVEFSRKKNERINLDSVEIKNRVNSRLNDIHNELKTIQTSLTKNQIIKEGIRQLKDAASNNDELNDILNEIKFENTNVLHEFIGVGLNLETLNEDSDKIDKLINDDISRIKLLQIEFENILAADLVGFGIEKIIEDIETSLSKTDPDSINYISNIKSDRVKNLIR